MGWRVGVTIKELQDEGVVKLSHFIPKLLLSHHLLLHPSYMFLEEKLFIQPFLDFYPWFCLKKYEFFPKFVSGFWQVAAVWHEHEMWWGTTCFLSMLCVENYCIVLPLPVLTFVLILTFVIFIYSFITF